MAASCASGLRRPKPSQVSLFYEGYGRRRPVLAYFKYAPLRFSEAAIFEAA